MSETVYQPTRRLRDDLLEGLWGVVDTEFIQDLIENIEETIRVHKLHPLNDSGYAIRLRTLEQRYAEILLEKDEWEKLMEKAE